MTIRPATRADVPEIVAMALRFQESSSYAQHLRATEETHTANAKAVLHNPDAAVWLAIDAGRVLGMLAAGLYVQPMSGELVGSEICWWIEPAARGGTTAIRMVKIAEEWARERGAVIFQMMAPDPRVGRVYERLGYAPIETHYQRRLTA